MYFKASHFFNSLTFLKIIKVETSISGNQLSKHVWTCDLIRHVLTCAMAKHV